MPTRPDLIKDPVYSDGRLDDLRTAIPHRRLEPWRWTDVAGALATEPVGLSASLDPRIVAPEGIRISVRDMVADDRPMSGLTQAFGGREWVIEIPDGMVFDQPLLIDNLARGNGRISIEIGRGAKVSITEHHVSDPGAFVNLDLRIVLAEGASLTRTIVQDDPADAVRIAVTHLTLWKDTALRQHAVGFGGSLCRLETRIAAMGPVDVIAKGAYLLDGKRHVDMTSYIDLAAPDATVRQSVKGVASDKSTGVFQGKFHVRRPAQHTDAVMRHDALMLSETAQIRSKPELEIYADDVACEHGNTIGQLDESALFYMRQRGIPEAQARALLTEAFLCEAFDTVEDEDMRESLRGLVRGRLA